MIHGARADQPRSATWARGSVTGTQLDPLFVERECRRFAREGAEGGGMLSEFGGDGT